MPIRAIKPAIKPAINSPELFRGRWEISAMGRERVKIVYEPDEIIPPKSGPGSGRKLFQKGHAKLPGAGRTKGSENKVKTLLKEALMIAAELEGSDRKGKDGLIGFLRMKSRTEPVAYMRLLEKLLPYQITGKDGGPMALVHTSREELLLRFRERGLPPPASLSAPINTPQQKDFGDEN